MRHKFERNEIPEGETSIVETCMHCDATRTRFRSGAIAYPGGKAGECTGDEQSAPDVPVPAPVPEQHTPSPSVAGKPWDDHVQAARDRRAQPPLGETEARLKEALVFLRLAYQDLVSHAPFSPTARMVGTYLYGDTYDQARKTVER